VTLNDERLQVKTLLSENGGLEPVREDLGVLVLDELAGGDFEYGVELFQGETFGCRGVWYQLCASEASQALYLLSRTVSQIINIATTFNPACDDTDERRCQIPEKSLYSRRSRTRRLRRS
jgi:hypothetical protein